MRIGVVADSHGNLFILDKLLTQMGELDMIIHLGDHYRDIVKINDKYKNKIEYVNGNNDSKGDAEAEKVLNLGGKRIFITHGDKYNVYYGIDRLYYKAQEVEADAVLFGHTHKRSREDFGGIMFLNPGSPSSPRDRKAGGLILTIENNIIEPNFVNLIL